MALFEQLSAGFPPIELRLIDLTIRMFSEPSLWLDGNMLHDHLGSVRRAKEVYLNKYMKEDLMSNDKFAQLLNSLGVTPPTKISPATGKETWAFAKTDEGFKALLEHEEESVQLLPCSLRILRRLGYFTYSPFGKRIPLVPSTTNIPLRPNVVV